MLKVVTDPLISWNLTIYVIIQYWNLKTGFGSVEITLVNKVIA